MLNRSRREFMVAAGASLLYGPRRSLATEATAARLGVILPLASPTFGAAAESVRRGFEQAARLQPTGVFDITFYSSTEDPQNVVAGFRQAMIDAPQIIVGPLTRNGVTAVVQRVQPGVPVLVLNVPETDVPLPEAVYAFSLQVEAEAKQIAQMAFADGRRSALTLADDHPLARRIERAFVETFTRQGGQIVAQFAYRNTVSDLMALREAATGGGCDTVMMALDGAHARLVRGYVDGPAQIYATSHILQGQPDRLRDVELNGVRFVGMPWFLQRDHPAVMVYAGGQSDPPAVSDMEKLYAFGIDAYRLATALLSGFDLAREPLDGVTGRIWLGADRHFVRELTAAQFVDGRAVPVSSRP